MLAPPDWGIFFENIMGNKIELTGNFTMMNHSIKRLKDTKPVYNEKTGKTTKPKFTTDKKLILCNLIEKYNNFYDQEKKIPTRKENEYHFHYQQVKLAEELGMTDRGIRKILDFLQYEGYIKYFSTNKERCIYRTTYIYMNIQFLMDKLKEVELPIVEEKQKMKIEMRKQEEQSSTKKNKNMEEKVNSKCEEIIQEVETTQEMKEDFKEEKEEFEKYDKYNETHRKLYDSAVLRKYYKAYQDTDDDTEEEKRVGRIVVQKINDFINEYPKSFSIYQEDSEKFKDIIIETGDKFVEKFGREAYDNIRINLYNDDDKKKNRIQL